MYFNIIASGSKGNASVFVHKNTVILIDMGISLCRLEEGLAEMNLSLKDIDFALFTHDHSDHIGGIKFLSPKIMYSLEGTLPSTLTNTLIPSKTVQLKDFKVTAYKTNHDAKNPCGFFLDDGKETLAYFTDTGEFPNEVIEHIKNPTYLVIESNHDIKMLMETNRPFELKNRILSEHGHLCNEDSAIATCSIIGPDTKEVILAHLSEEANTPEVAVEAYKRIFEHFKKDMSSFDLKTAHQHHSTMGGTYEN